VQQLVKDGRLPAKEFGGSLMIEESDLSHVSDRKPGRPPKAKDATKKTKDKQK
jgi:hypothetical protein